MTSISCRLSVDNGSGDEPIASIVAFLESIAATSGLKTRLFLHHAFAGALHDPFVNVAINSVRGAQFKARKPLCFRDELSVAHFMGVCLGSRTVREVDRTWIDGMLRSRAWNHPGSNTWPRFSAC